MTEYQDLDQHPYTNKEMLHWQANGEKWWGEDGRESARRRVKAVKVGMGKRERERERERERDRGLTKSESSKIKSFKSAIDSLNRWLELTQNHSTLNSLPSAQLCRYGLLYQP